MHTLPNNALAMGQRPALIVVDATVAFTDPASPLGCESGAALAAIQSLITAFRARELPIVFTVNAYAHAAEAPIFRAKLPLLELLVAGSPGAEIAPALMPQPQDLLLRKTVPSAFFDSPLRQLLSNAGVDTAVVCGFSTSGCVRATAVDALQCNLRLFVITDACGDRDSAAHAANLRDLGLKYGELLTAEQAIALLPA